MLRWQATSAYHAISQCRRYHVCVVKVVRNGKVVDYYDGWYGTTNLDANHFAEHIRGSTRKDVVLRALEAHAEQNPQPQPQQTAA